MSSAKTATLPPLLAAAAEGNISLLRELFHPSFIQELVDTEGKTALHLAAENNRQEIVQFLIDNGMPVDMTSKKGLTPFHYAVARGHFAIAQSLADAGANVHAVDSAGRTALHLCAVSPLPSPLLSSSDFPSPTLLSEGAAVAVPAPPLLSWLLSLGLSPLAASPEGMRLAHFAALGGRLDILRWFAANEETVTGSTGGLLVTTNAGLSCMHLACMKGHTQVAQWLHGAGLDANAKDNRGRSPLHLATAGQHSGLVLWLLSVGANASAVDGEGKTALALANSMASLLPGGATKELQQSIVYLTNAVSPPPPPTAFRALDEEEYKLLSVTHPAIRLPMPGYGVTYNSVYLRWEAPAVPPGGLAIQDYMIQYSTKWALGWTDALLAFEVSSATGDGMIRETRSSTSTTFACVTSLPSTTTFTFRIKARNANGWGAPATTSKFEDFTTLVAPTPAVADVKAAAPLKAAPQMAPTLFLPPEMKEMLVSDDFSAIVKVHANETAASLLLEGVTDDHWRTALHLAAFGGFMETCIWLLERGAAIDAKDKVGATPFLLAVIGGHLPVVKALAFHGADVNARDNRGYTSLQYAALQSRVSVFRWLCEAGAAIDLRNSDSTTVRDILEKRMVAVQSSSEKREEAALLSSLLSLLDNAGAAPSAPNPPSFVDSSRHSVLLDICSFKPLAGAPAVECLEMQYAGTLSIFSTSVSNSILPPVDIFSEDYLMSYDMTGTDEGGHVSVSVPNLSAESKYVFQVRAKNRNGWGPWSAKSAEVQTRSTNDRHQIPSHLIEAAAESIGHALTLPGKTTPSEARPAMAATLYQCCFTADGSRRPNIQRHKADFNVSMAAMAATKISAALQPLLAAANDDRLPVLSNNANLQQARSLLLERAKACKCALTANLDELFDVLEPTAKSWVDACSACPSTLGEPVASAFTKVAMAATFSGSLGCLQWLLGSDATTIAMSEEGVKALLLLDIVGRKLLHSHGFWQMAALGDQMLLLQTILDTIASIGGGGIPVDLWSGLSSTWGINVLGYAILGGSDETVRFILDNGCGSSIILSSVSQALTANSADHLRLLLSRNTEPIPMETISNWMNIAAAANAADSLSVLIDSFKERTLQRPASWGAVHAASAAGSLSCLLLLLLNDFDGEIADDNGRSPADLARGCGQSEVERLLHAWQADRGVFELPPGIITVRRTTLHQGELDICFDEALVKALVGLPRHVSLPPSIFPSAVALEVAVCPAGVSGAAAQTAFLSDQANTQSIPVPDVESLSKSGFRIRAAVDLPADKRPRVARVVFTYTSAAGGTVVLPSAAVPV